MIDTLMLQRLMIGGVVIVGLLACGGYDAPDPETTVFDEGIVQKMSVTKGEGLCDVYSRLRSGVTVEDIFDHASKKSDVCS